MNARARASAPVVILCGFMGTGKSSVGRSLSCLLGVPLFDTDEMIESREGKTIAEIFARRGETYFRKLERDILEELDIAGGAVVATGGGMVVEQDNFARLESMGVLIHLDAGLDVIARRIGADALRPMAAGATEGWADLYEQRRPMYARIAQRVDTSQRSAEETAVDIAEAVLSGGNVMHLRVNTLPIPGVAATVTNTRLSRIVIGRGVAARLGEWLDRLGLAGDSGRDTPSVVFLIPRRIEKLYLQQITAPLDKASISWRRIHVRDGDADKTIEQTTGLLDELAGSGASRSTVVVTVGGGVTGDIGGLVASLYMRGVPWFNIPTTLLAQVDASIGGKVGVNTERAKNLVGAFHQPLVVLSDPDLLTSLPPREIANGMAEVVKTAMIGDAEFFAELVGGATIDADFLEHAVRVCSRIKGAIVEADPYERDLRRVLNLGHTLGHALEAAGAYTGLSHGEAVALGLLAALRVAIARGDARTPYLDD
ncbi:MAG: iron-containing alcohol dehydrogenase, partial [Candidatus Krumholzibacteriota bacterium]|nr:iron-containing alcohol dehydrogenase [Candidatus Krumholzibacteriota bacterium]